MADGLKMATLGGLTILYHGAPLIGLASRKAEALLIYLACTRRPHPRDALSDLLWNELPTERARGNLSVLLTSLRRQLSPYLLITRQTLAFNFDAPYWLDAAELEAHYRAVQCRAPDGEPLPRSAVAPLAGALKLYQGDFLQGFALRDSPGFEEWALAEQERLRQLAIAARRRLVTAYHAQHDYAAGIEQANELLRMDPLSEEAHRQLMLLLLSSGQRAAALAQYESCRRALAEELGVAPAEETSALYQHIRAGDLASTAAPADRPGAQATVALRSGRPSTPPNLPFQPTAFVGRNAELAQIASRLSDPACRLLTLLGPGGIGKTRLAIQAAAIHSAAFADGAAFVALASIGAASQIVHAIGTALDLSFAAQGDPTGQLLRSLREQHMLLVLDNFEHLIEGVDLVNAILQHAPRVSLLVTSRERLNLEAEWLLDVGGLTYPTAGTHEDATPLEPARMGDYSAIQLFGQRAARVQPQFALSATTLPAVIQICQQVEGMPLAIELAAAWARAMPVTEIALKIAADLDFLATTLRDKPPRHRSLRAVFEQSWNLLAEPERALLARLAVFRGGCTDSATEQVAGATSQLLAALVDKSLLRRVPDEDIPRPGGVAHEHQTARFEMLEPIREYALEQLAMRGEEQPLRHAHAAYFLALMETAAPELDGPDANIWLARVARDHENMRAALAWSLADQETRDTRHETRDTRHETRDTRHEVQTSPLSPVSGLRSPVSNLAVSLSRLELGLRLASALGRFWLIRGHTREGRDWLARLLAAADAGRTPVAPEVRARALQEAALLAYAQDEFAQASALFVTSAVITRADGRPYDMTALLVNAAMRARNEGDYRLATALLEECLAQQRTRGNRAGIAQSGLGLVLFRLGLVLREQGAYERAATLYEECLALHRDLADRSGIAVALQGLGDLARDQGDTARMHAYCTESLALFRDLGEQWGIGFSLNNLALAAFRTGDLPQAIALSVESVALFRSLEMAPGIAETLTTWGCILAAQGDIARARALLFEALALTRSHGPQWLLANQLEDLAAFAIVETQALRAARLAGVAARLREAICVPLPPARQASHERVVAAARAALDPETWRQAWAGGQALPLDQAVGAAVDAEILIVSADGEQPPAAALDTSIRNDAEIAPQSHVQLSQPRLKLSDVDRLDRRCG